jgi:hypothetical protein
MAAVDQAQLAVSAELSDYQGDEVLLAKPRADAAVQLGGQLNQLGVGGGRAEAGQHHRGQLHRLQALPFTSPTTTRRPWRVAATS